MHLIMHTKHEIMHQVAFLCRKKNFFFPLAIHASSVTTITKMINELPKIAEPRCRACCIVRVVLLLDRMYVPMIFFYVVFRYSLISALLFFVRCNVQSHSVVLTLRESFFFRLKKKTLKNSLFPPACLFLREENLVCFVYEWSTVIMCNEWSSD